MLATDTFLNARDFLSAHRSDPEGAWRGFAWPQLEHFNWALDYFDQVADAADRLALWVVH